MFKAKNQRLPKHFLYLLDVHQKRKSDITLSDFIIPRFNTIKRYGTHFSKYLWYKLTKEERSMNSLNSFKQQISRSKMKGARTVFHALSFKKNSKRVETWGESRH